VVAIYEHVSVKEWADRVVMWILNSLLWLNIVKRKMFVV